MILPPSRRLSPLAWALATLPLSTFGQTIPNSGQILQQVQPHAPSKPSAEPQLNIEPPPTSATTDATPFTVKRFEIDGNTAFPTSTLHALIADDEGRTLSLTGLNTLAQRITDYYRAHGYPLARAFIPAQTLDSGTVRIHVVEARYDKVRADNHSRANDRLVRATLEPLHSGTIVKSSTLDLSLLLLGELPGASPQATLRPGAAPGTSSLDVAVAATPTVQGSLSLDDAGTRYTGRMRASASLAINEPLHQGDQLNLGALTAGHGMRYGRVGYQFTLNGQGTRAGAAYSALAYALGGPLRALDASGTAQVGSAWLTQPVLRSRSRRLDVRLQVDHKQLRDEIGSATLHNDRHTDSATLSMVGQRADNWAGGGTNTASLSITHGTLRFDDVAAEAADAASARTQGSYTHWNANLARLQNLSAGTRLYVSLSAQHGTGNLDSSEQFLLGGTNNVRGYDSASVAGDSGWVGTLELRHDLDWGCAGHCEGSVFVDHGRLRISSNPWTSGSNYSRLSSAGIGFTWIGANRWQAQVQVATPFGAQPLLTGKDADARIWLWLLKGF